MSKLELLRIAVIIFLLQSAYYGYREFPRQYNFNMKYTMRYILYYSCYCMDIALLAYFDILAKILQVSVLIVAVGIVLTIPIFGIGIFQLKMEELKKANDMGKYISFRRFRYILVFMECVLIALMVAAGVLLQTKT